MVDARPVFVLKAVARRNYKRFHTLLQDHDCGIALLKEVCPEARWAAQRYNDAMNELRRVDPQCPEFDPL